MQRILIAIFLLCISGVAFAEESKPIAETDRTICEYVHPGKNISKWVTSKAGFSAASELRARVTGKGSQRHCLTSWILHLRRQNSQDRTLMVAQRDDVPEDNEWMQENIFEIEAWSKDGKMVLISQIGRASCRERV